MVHANIFTKIILKHRDHASRVFILFILLDCPEIIFNNWIFNFVYLLQIFILIF